MSDNLSWSSQILLSQIISLIGKLVANFAVNMIPDKSNYKICDILQYKNDIEIIIENYVGSKEVQDQIKFLLVKNEIEPIPINISYVKEQLLNKLNFYIQDIKLTRTIYNLNYGELLFVSALISNTYEETLGEIIPIYYIGFKSDMMTTLWGKLMGKYEDLKISDFSTIDYIVSYVLNINPMQYIMTLRSHGGIRRHNRRKTDRRKFDLSSAIIFLTLQEAQNAIEELEPQVIMAKLTSLD